MCKQESIKYSRKVCFHEFHPKMNLEKENPRMENFAIVDFELTRKKFGEPLAKQMLMLMQEE